MSLRSPKGIAVVGLAVVVSGMIISVALRRHVRLSPSNGKISDREAMNVAAQLDRIEAKERQANETVWKSELLGQRCGAVFEQLWDAVNASTNKLAVLGELNTGNIEWPDLGVPRVLAHEICFYQPAERSTSVGAAEWRRRIETAQRDGWELVQMEIRHNQFATDDSGRPEQSRFYCSVHLTNALRSERAIIEGDLIVQWNIDPLGQPKIDRIDASRLAVRRRQGAPAFRLVLNAPIAPMEKSHFIDPLILYDLDGDGTSEIILAARNLIFRRGSDGQFRSEPLCLNPPGLIFTGVIADFDSDGTADFLCARFDGLVLFKGSPKGTFDEAGQPVWQANPRLKYAQVLTCGDIDHDGDLDVWLGQYKVPYERGQMPTPFYNANDGNPSFLLLNDGHGYFSNATDVSGLAAKRWRRVYSGSFADLDNDGNLDLLIVSDFAGVDVFRNDGTGHFADMTNAWIDEPHGFGMAHALADFDGNGGLDLLMIGMNSPAADRLESLRLKRPGFEKQDAMRPPMVFGNRLYLGTGGGRFKTAPFNPSIARSGWSWGCSSFDFDNDGFADVYVANGHESGRSVRDYEKEFWLHDIYVGNSRESDAAIVYFAKQIARTRGNGESYGGHERNRLYLNQNGQSFLEIAHLMGVALPEDSRNVVTDDLDGDGRMDLIVTTFEAWPERKQTLRVFQNTLPTSGNWIGFRLHEQIGGPSPVGAHVTVHHANGTFVRELITGDSYRSQHANTVHFGLGKLDQVSRVEIRWANGRTQVVEVPAINRYYEVAAVREVK